MSTGVVQAASFLNPLCLGGESTQNTRSGTNEPNFYSVKPKKTNPNEPISKPFLSQSNPKFRLLEIPTQGEAEGHRAATRGATLKWQAVTSPVKARQCKNDVVKNMKPEKNREQTQAALLFLRASSFFRHSSFELRHFHPKG